MRVTDVMTPMPVTTNASASIDEAAWVMLEYGVGGLPVMHYGRLVGVITQGDLVERFVPRERVRWWRVLIEHERLARECQRVRGATVGEVMSRPALVVAADDAIEVAAALLHAHAIGRLPVMDHGGLIGIVTHSDLLRRLTGARPAKPRAACVSPGLPSAEVVVPGGPGTSDPRRGSGSGA
jgi:CBS domain-containing protein